MWRFQLQELTPFFCVYLYVKFAVTPAAGGNAPRGRPYPPELCAAYSRGPCTTCCQRAWPSRTPEGSQQLSLCVCCCDFKTFGLLQKLGRELFSDEAVGPQAVHVAHLLLQTWFICIWLAPAQPVKPLLKPPESFLFQTHRMLSQG